MPDGARPPGDASRREPARASAGRRRRRLPRRGALARAGAQPALRLRGARAAGHGPQLLLRSPPRGTSRTRRSRLRCGPPTRRSSTTARAPSTSRGRRRRAGTGCRTSCGASRPRGTSRSRGAGTRCSATTRSPSSRRRRRSPRTCRAPSASRSRSSGRGSSASSRPGPRTRSSSAASATPRSTTRPRRRRLNSAAHLAHQGLPLPLLFVCEDNRLGISVRSPAGWVESALRARPALRYEAAPGDDPEVALETARGPRRWRSARSAGPAVLHLRTVRFLSHAGADVETAYRTPQEIRADWNADPLLATGRWLAAAGARTGVELAEDYLAERERVLGAARDAARLPQLESAEDVMRPLAPADGAAGGHNGRRRGGGHARAVRQPRARRRARARSPRAPLRRGRRGEGRRLRRHARAAAAVRRRARLRHAARRDVDPRPRARYGRHRLPPRARDPVPRLPAQRRGPASRGGGDPAVLLAGAVPQRDGDPDRRLRLPEGLRRPLPQRRRGRRCSATSPGS